MEAVSVFLFLLYLCALSGPLTPFVWTSVSFERILHFMPMPAFG